MKIVGLTGGIGSGKTTVAKMFNDLGIPVYIADDEAKKIMHTTAIKDRIIQLLGKDSYLNGALNRPYISSKIFQNSNLLDQLNIIVHPEVGKHFKAWAQNQLSVYVIKEAAILFENGNYKHCDKTIIVIANRKKRIDRVIQRDQTTAQKVLNVIENQWTDDEKIKLADFVIENNSDLNTLKAKVYTIHEELMKLFT